MLHLFSWVVFMLLVTITAAENNAKEVKKPLPFNGHVSVLVVSYHRSGSSFLGDALSRRPDTSYFFEPLFRDMLELNHTSDEDHMKFLEDIFNCDQQVLDGIRFGDLWIMRKLGGVTSPLNFKNPPYTAKSVAKLCSKAKVQVIKETRARLPMVAKMVSAGRVKNLKIIHLVRDPRARLNSILQLSCKEQWGSEYENLTKFCEQMNLDAKTVDKIPASSYLQLKYEDLASDLNGTLYRLDKFLGIPLHEDTEEFIKWNTVSKKQRDDPELLKMAKEEFSTFRTSDFNPNHWMKTLTNKTVIEAIEKECEPIMTLFGYEKTTEIKAV